jgi:TolB-like protein/DNA-binding SARP family transcriptional activator/tetratricopeptide (TPR) repeat protein
MSFSLRLFGAPGVDGPDGPLSGRIAQRHPLALLAVLAAAPSATASRDRLLGLLWPESHPERARALLNVAVHAVRKAMGEGAVVSVGGSLQLDEAVVRSDLRAFADAVARGDDEAAVQAYAGPFLDGFYLDAEGFDGWVDGERATLAARFADALERLAEGAEAAGDAVRAAGWWKRRAGHDPCDSRVALRLMQALATTGDRAGAIQHARVHEALLRDALGAAPAPEVAAFAERLRTEPAPAAPAADPRADGEARVAAADPAPASASIDPAPVAGEEEAEASAPVASLSTEVGEDARHPSSPRTATRRWRGRRRRMAVAWGASLALAGAASAALWTEGGRIRMLGAAETLPPEGPVVAVLPFADRGREGGSELLGDGMSEEIITALARLSTMRVVARTSAFAFRDSALDVREIGARLGARYVLEGSVGSAGDRLRIHALLVSVEDGVQVWSGSYDRAPGEVFAVQDEIARGIVGALRPRVAQRPLVRPPTDDLEAYDLYLEARQSSSRRTLEGLVQGIELLNQAVARDSAFAEAYAGLAECHTLLVTYGAVSPREGYPRARRAAERALRLDPSLAEAHAALALVRMYFERDWRAAGREFQAALREKPGYATARHWYATWLSYQGRFDEALAAIAEAQRLDPYSVTMYTGSSTILYYAQRYDASIDRARAALVIDPGFWLSYLQMAAVYAQQGRYDEALASVERARRLSSGHPLPEALRGYVLARAGRRDEALAIIRALEAQGSRRYVSPAYAAAIYTGLGDADAALRWLERAYEANDDWAVYLAVEPVFEPLRNDPRFVNLLARVERGR